MAVFLKKRSWVCPRPSRSKSDRSCSAGISQRFFRRDVFRKGAGIPALFFLSYCPIFCESCSNCGGASRAISSLAPVPVWSCTKVHSNTVLGAKLDIAPRCIHRSQTEPFLELEKKLFYKISDIIKNFSGTDNGHGHPFRLHSR